MSRTANDAGHWLKAARAGSREALGQALEACRGYLLLVAQRELDSDLRAKGGASDLVQETFLEAQRDFAGFDGSSEAELVAWLRRLLLNNLANFARRYRDTDKRNLAREVAFTGDSGTQPAAEAPDRDMPSPSRQMIAHEKLEALQRAMAQLPEDYRRVLLYRYQAERSFEEIGRLMDRSPNAARKLWSRAIERLQQELDARHEHESG